VWAVRDGLRRPGETLLLVIGLAAVIATVATPLLLGAAITAAVDDVLRGGPALVVRKVDGGGWEPMPVGPALTAAVGVPGVISAAPRLWGVVGGPSGPLTVVGLDGEALSRWKSLLPVPPPASGQAVAGPSAAPFPGERLRLTGRRSRSFRVTGILKPEAGAAVADVVVLEDGDARYLLGVPEGFASDLALEVFHEEEAEALKADLAEAFPWPVDITTRGETRERYHGGLSARSGLAAAAALPAVVALALLVTAASVSGFRRRTETALLKALGWTMGDVVALRMLYAGWVAAGGAALGGAAAWVLVFLPGAQWASAMLLGWKGDPPGLYLQPAEAPALLAVVVALVLVPYLAAVLWPALQVASAAARETSRGDWTL
jgi:hypothetical protein